MSEQTEEDMQEHEALIIQKIIDFMAEQFSQIKEENLRIRNEIINDEFRNMDETTDSTFKRLNETIDSAFERTNETIDRAFERTNETIDRAFERTNEHFENKIEGLREQKKNMEAMIENNKKHRETLNKNMEQLSQEIENKEDKSALLSESKHNTNKENIQHIEGNINGVKNQIIKKTKKIRKIWRKELINTWEGLKMKNGLVNVLNLPGADHREIINVKNYRRSLMGIFEETRNKTVSKNLRKAIFNLNTPEEEIHNKRSVISPIIDIPLKYLFSKLDDKVIDVGLDTSKNFVSEKLQYKVVESYITRTEIIWNTTVIRGISANEVIDHG